MRHHFWLERSDVLPQQVLRFVIAIDKFGIGVAIEWVCQDDLLAAETAASLLSSSIASLPHFPLRSKIGWLSSVFVTVEIFVVLDRSVSFFRSIFHRVNRLFLLITSTILGEVKTL